MAFEKFTEMGRSYKPKLSIRGTGQIGLNLGAIRKFLLSKYKYAVLYYDRENKRIGIRLTNKEEEGIFKLAIRNSSATISAKTFLDYYDIDYGAKIKKYSIKYDEREDMLVIDLDETNHDEEENVI